MTVIETETARAAEPGQTPETIREISLDSLAVHPRNPRHIRGDLSTLASSIREHGVLQPVVVVQREGAYLVVMGSRRLAASRIAERPTIPTILREWTDDEAAIAALTENVQRADLEPLEEAEAFAREMAAAHLSQRALARELGKSQAFVAHRIGLLRLAPAIRDALSTHRITAAVAVETFGVVEPELVARLPLEDATVMQMRAAVAALLKKPRRRTRPAPPAERPTRRPRAKPTTRRISIPLLAQIERLTGADDPETALRAAIRFLRARRRPVRR